MGGGVDWVALLGPGGVIALVLGATKLLKVWRDARTRDARQAVDQWRAISANQEVTITNLRDALTQMTQERDYWQLRTGRLEYMLTRHGIELPAPIPKPAISPEELARRQSWFDHNMYSINGRAYEQLEGPSQDGDTI